jgi:hypothetical protein
MKYVAVLLGMAFSGCAVKTVNAIPSDPNCICTMEYDPVCVKVNGVRYVYTNPCNAACDGYGEDDFVPCPE